MTPLKDFFYIPVTDMSRLLGMYKAETVLEGVPVRDCLIVASIKPGGGATAICYQNVAEGWSNPPKYGYLYAYTRTVFEWTLASKMRDTYRKEPICPCEEE